MTEDIHRHFSTDYSERMQETKIQGIYSQELMDLVSRRIDIDKRINELFKLGKQYEFKDPRLQEKIKENDQMLEKKKQVLKRMRNFRNWVHFSIYFIGFFLSVFLITTFSINSSFISIFWSCVVLIHVLIQRRIHQIDSVG